MSPSLDKRNCCVFWTLKWDHMHFVYFFCLALGYTRPPLREILPLWHSSFVTGDIRVIYTCQGSIWTISLMAVTKLKHIHNVLPCARGSTFSHGARISQNLRFFPIGGKKKNQKKNSPDCTNVTPHWDQTLNRSPAFFYLLWDPLNCEDGSGWHTLYL